MHYCYGLRCAALRAAKELRYDAQLQSLTCADCRPENMHIPLQFDRFLTNRVVSMESRGVLLVIQ